MKKTKAAVLAGCAVCIMFSAGYASYRYETERLAEKYYKDLEHTVGPGKETAFETTGLSPVTEPATETVTETEAETEPDTIPGEETEAEETELQEPSMTEPPETVPPETVPETEAPSHGNESRQTTVDFEALYEINPWIYAWIEIPGTNLSYPVVQHPIDDAYYLNYSVENKYSPPGAIFTYHDSKTDLSGFNTIFYGHNCSGTSMFGYLNNFMDYSYFMNHREIVIYTPEKKLTYKIFAAVAYSEVLINKAFNNDLREDRQRYIDSLYELRNLNSILADDVEVTPDSHLITLSTCISWMRDKRWLVVAVLNDG